MPKEEFLSLLHYVSGVLGSDAYNEKSLVQEERDEERLTTYIHELSNIYRNNVTDKKAIRLETEKVFRQLTNDIVLCSSTFRNSTNLFKTLAGLGHIVTLPQQAIDLVKAKPVELNKLTTLSDFISIVKGTSIKDNLTHFQTYLSKLSRMENLAIYSGLQSFLMAINQAPDINVVTKEMAGILKSLEKSLSTLPFASLLQLAQISAKLNNGKINETLVQVLDSRTKEEAIFMDRNDFRQYFSLARYTGQVSPAVIQSFIELKTRNKEIELKPDWIKELIAVYRGLPSKSEGVDLLLAEFEADLAHLDVQLNNPLYMTGAMRRLYN